MDQTRQGIILIERLEVKPVQSGNVRKLLKCVDEWRYKCNKPGGTALGGVIVTMILIKCIPRVL